MKLSKRMSAIFLTLVFISALLMQTDIAQASFSNDWKTWSQGGSEAKYVSNLGGYAFQKYGCHFVAQCKLMAEAGIIDPNTFKPDNYFDWVVSKGSKYIYPQANGTYAIGEKSIGASMIDYAKEEKGVSISRIATVSLSGKTVDGKKATIQSYINQGMYVILDCDSHETYIMQKESQSRGTPWISDSGSSKQAVSFSSGIYAYTGSYGGGGGWEADFVRAYVYSTSGVAPVSSAYIGRCTAPSALAINDAPAASPSYSNQIGRIPNGETCTVYPDKSSGSWLWVEYNGVQGYAYGSYIEYYSPTPSIPQLAELAVNPSNKTVGISWNDVANETGYDVYLIQAPWNWADVKYQQHIGANETGCVFYNVAPGHYCVFVISRPNAADRQSTWWDFTMDASPCIVIFNSNGGSAVTSQTVESGKYAHPPANPTRSGYIFAGWCKNEECSQFFDFAGETITSNLTLYAKWIDRSNLPLPQKTEIYNGHTYMYYSENMIWSAANEVCKAAGGHLATIASAAENSFVSELRGQSLAWLGGTDSRVEGTWEWVTGEPFSYTNWELNQPDNWQSVPGDGEDYLNMYGGGIWNDNSSTVAMSFICEIDALPSTITDAGFSNGSCSANVSCNVSGATVLFAGYGNDGRMLVLKSAPIRGGGGYYNFGFDTSVSYVKIFVVDANYVPLCEAATARR